MRQEANLQPLKAQHSYFHLNQYRFKLTRLHYLWPFSWILKYSCSIITYLPFIFYHYSIHYYEQWVSLWSQTILRFNVHQEHDAQANSLNQLLTQICFWLQDFDSTELIQDYWTSLLSIQVSDLLIHSDTYDAKVQSTPTLLILVLIMTF